VICSFRAPSATLCSRERRARVSARIAGTTRKQREAATDGRTETRRPRERAGDDDDDDNDAAFESCAGVAAVASDRPIGHARGARARSRARRRAVPLPAAPRAPRPRARTRRSGARGSASGASARARGRSRGWGANGDVARGRRRGRTWSGPTGRGGIGHRDRIESARDRPRCAPRGIGAGGRKDAGTHLAMSRCRSRRASTLAKRGERCRGERDEKIVGLPENRNVEDVCVVRVRAYSG
jgi:hypothetical protein